MSETALKLAGKFDDPALKIKIIAEAPNRVEFEVTGTSELIRKLTAQLLFSDAVGIFRDQRVRLQADCARWETTPNTMTFIARVKAEN